MAWGMWSLVNDSRRLRAPGISTAGVLLRVGIWDSILLTSEQIMSDLLSIVDMGL